MRINPYFLKVPADCYIDTNRLTRRMVYQRALREIGAIVNQRDNFS